ncbi:MAG: hypothetical protein U1E27_12835, partial [Kiritimatiellia bacterium]|nr:hypothetical protein [Kiritimatiellia bacterium]
MDETSVKQKMLPGCLILLVVALSFYAIRSNNLMVGMLLLSVPIGIGLIMHPVLTATLVPVFYYSKLMLPGIPGSFLIAYMLMMI